MHHMNWGKRENDLRAGSKALKEGDFKRKASTPDSGAQGKGDCMVASPPWQSGSEAQQTWSGGVPGRALASVAMYSQETIITSKSD